jgi:Na+:H+ antiporter, NhaA family
VIAGWPALTPGHVAGGVTVLAAIGLAAWLRRRRVHQFWPYLIVAGTASWIGFYLAGVHPALALVPIVPFMPHESPQVDMFADRPVDTAVHHAEHAWNEVVQVIVFFFALVNAGVMIGGQDVGTWAVLAGALVGRPLGILAAVGLALALGLRLPRQLGWRQLIVIALATSSGFTIALFVASSLLPIGGVLQQIKFGALGTVVGAPLALLAAWLLHVGRFTAHRHLTGDTHGLSTDRR